MVGSFRCSIIGASRIFPPRFTAVRRRPPSPPPQFVGPDMSNEPVAPGLEPPPPPPAAPPPPSREEQVERVCPRFRPVFCFDESPRRLATSAAKLTLTRVDALLAELYGVPDFAAFAKSEDVSKQQ